METHKYIVTLEYVTPSGKRSSYTETVHDVTPFAAIGRAKEWLHKETRRRVARITNASVSR